MTNYSLTEEKNSLRQGLLIKTEMKVNKFAIEMSKKISGLADISKISSDSIYIETSKFHKLKELFDDEFNIAPTKILLDSVNIQIDCIKHLIPIETLLFDVEYSYYDFSSGKLVLIMLPLEMENNFEKSFKEWSIKILKELSDKCDSNIMSGLIRYIKSDSFCLNGLKQRLEEINNSDKITESKTKQKKNAKEGFSFVEKDEIPKQNKLRTNVQPNFLGSNNNLQKTVSKLPKDGVFNKTGKDSYNIEQEKNRFFSFSIIGSQLMFFLLFLSVSLFAVNKFENTIKTLSGILIIFIILDYIFIKHLLSKNKYSMKKSEFKEKRKKSTSKLKESFIKNIVEFEDVEKKQKNNSGFLYSDKTIGLIDFIENEMSLKSLESDNEHRILAEISRVGRNKNSVDIYINSPSIGREHAVIKKIGKKAYVKDNNSLNGSYINGIRLSNGEYTELKSGDIVSFSNESYMFCIK